MRLAPLADDSIYYGRRARGGCVRMLAWFRTGWGLFAEDGTHTYAEPGDLDLLIEECDPGDHVYMACDWRDVIANSDARRWGVRFYGERCVGVRLIEDPDRPHRRGESAADYPELIPGFASTLRKVAPSVAGRMRALVAWADWVRSHPRAEPGPPFRVARDLFRSALTSGLTLSAPPLGPERRVGIDALYGGRKEAPVCAERPGIANAAHWDLTAAYPTAMARMGRLPAVLRDTGLRHRLPSGVPGIVRATLDIPEQDWGPLPLHWSVHGALRMSNYGWGHVTGWWTWPEVETAVEVGGAKLRSLHKVYAPVAYIGRRPLDWWWEDSVLTGRALPDGGDALAKATLNRTWAIFLGGHVPRCKVHWWDASARIDPAVELVAPLPDPRSSHVAAEITSRVRRRLYSDALAPLGRHVLQCDTDGFLGPYDWPVGAAPAGWRRKPPRMAEVEVRGSQAYRYRCPGCDLPGFHPRWHYSVAGATSREEAVRRFDDTDPTMLATLRMSHRTKETPDDPYRSGAYATTVAVSRTLDTVPGQVGIRDDCRYVPDSPRLDLAL